MLELQPCHVCDIVPVKSATSRICGPRIQEKKECHAETSWKPPKAKVVYRCLFFCVDKMLPAVSGLSHHECPCSPVRSANGSYGKQHRADELVPSPFTAVSPDLRVSTYQGFPLHLSAHMPL